MLFVRVPACTYYSAITDSTFRGQIATCWFLGRKVIQISSRAYRNSYLDRKRHKRTKGTRSRLEPASCAFHAFGGETRLTSFRVPVPRLQTGGTSEDRRDYPQTTSSPASRHTRSPSRSFHSLCKESRSHSAIDRAHRTCSPSAHPIATVQSRSDPARASSDRSSLSKRRH